MRNGAKWVGQLYEIKVRGHLDLHRLQAFDRLVVAPEAGGETTIVTRIADQAALYGILVHIRDLGVSLISVRCLECDGTAVDLPPNRRRSKGKGV